MNFKHMSWLHRLAATLLLSICFIPSVQAAEKLVLQLRWLHQAQFIGYYVAQHNGYYAEAGLDVDIREGGPDIIPWKEVINGNADYAVDNTNAFTAYHEGHPVVALAAVFQHSPSIFLTKRSSGISTIKEMQGKRVMAFPGNQDPELMAMLSQQKMDRTQLSLLPTSANIHDLILDKVDVFNAYITNEPYYLEQANIPFYIINPRHYGIDFYSDLLITNHSRVDKKPDQVRRFHESSLKGWLYALNHPEEALDILESNYPVKKNRAHSRYELNRVREMVLPDFVEIGHINPIRLKQIEKELLHLGVINKTVNLESFVYKPSKPLDITPWIPWIIIGAGIFFLAIAGALFLSYMNKRLSREIASRKETEAQLLHLATHDPLTNLPNRTLLNEQLEVFINLAQRNVTTPALIYIDLDGFKEVNDQYGHHQGDQLLKNFAERIQVLIRKSDLFGRLAGDEFLIVLENSRAKDILALAEKVQNDIRTPYYLNGEEIVLDASIGIAHYTDTNESASSFLNRADKAMYLQKKSGKGGIHFAQRE